MSPTPNSIVLDLNRQKQSVSDAIQDVVTPPSAAPTLYLVASYEFSWAKIQLLPRLLKLLPVFITFFIIFLW